MKYLVHETTKEHVIWESGMPTSAPGYKCVEADEEGWIPWNANSGRGCPLPCNCKVAVKYSGEIYDEDFAGYWRWHDVSITAYRPILETTEEEEPRRHGRTIVYIPESQKSVFDRLKSAIAASESIPAIIAEIDALLPEGYCVAKREEHPAEDMSDWRNWREGDLVEAIETYKDSYIQGDTYKIREVFGGTIYTEFDAKGSAHNGWAPRFFRFHSRPAKVTE